jgi:hypothetical protein
LEIFLLTKDISHLTELTNSELDKLNHWFKLNKLSLNINKTNYILIHTKNKKIANFPKIKIENKIIEQVTKTRFLGIIINETFTWHDHITLIKQKIVKNTGVIYRLSKIMPPNVLQGLYNSLINPYLEYCNIVWALNKNSILNDLYICQKKSIRIITHSQWLAHSAPLFKKLRVLPVHNIDELQLACFMYQCVNNKLPNYFCDMYMKNSDVHVYNTRQKDQLHQNCCMLNLRACTVRFAGVNLWNSVSNNSEIQSARDVHQFRRIYKNMLLNAI